MNPQQLIDAFRASHADTPDALRNQLAGDPDLRLAVLELLLPQLSERDAPLLRWLLHVYTQEYRASASSGDDLYLCAFMLYRLGRLDDVLPLWAAKQASFDTYCGFDVQLLVGAGVAPTLVYLRRVNSEEAHSAAEYIERCHVADDIVTREEYIRWRTGYFSS